MLVNRVVFSRLVMVVMVLASQTVIAGNPLQLPKPAGRPIFQTPPIDIPVRRPPVVPQRLPNLSISPAGPVHAVPGHVPSVRPVPQPRPPSPRGFFPGDH